MGTIFAPTYAALTMGYFEVHFYNILRSQMGKKISRGYLRKLELFFRGLSNTDKNKVKSQELLETLNSVNEAI